MFIVSPLIPNSVETSVYHQFGEMSITVNPCLIAFAFNSVMVICLRSEFACPLVKQTEHHSKNYPNNKAGYDLTQSQFFWWNCFRRSRDNGFSFDLIYFCGQYLRIQQSNGCFGIRSANQQTYAARSC